MFEAERASLVPYAGPFDGFRAVPATVAKTCLVRFDNNKFSVSASAVGRPVEIRAYADRVELRQDGRVVGEHRRAAMGGLKLFGMKAAYDEIVATAVQREHEPQRVVGDLPGFLKAERRCRSLAVRTGRDDRAG